MSEDGGFRPAPLVLDASVLIEAARGDAGVMTLLQGYDADGQPLIIPVLAVTAASLDMRVPLRDPLTIADRVTEWPDRVLSLGGLLLLLLACRTRRRSQDDADVEASTLEPVGASS